MATLGCRVRAFAPLIATLVLLCPGRADAVLVAYDPFLTGDNRLLGQYTAGLAIREQGAAALGWVGTDGIDGFAVQAMGTSGNFRGNAGSENSPAVTYEQAGRMEWLGVGDDPFDRNITRQLNPIPQSSEWWFSIMVNRLGWVDPPLATTSTFVVGGFTDATGNGLQVGYDDTAGDGTPNLVLRTNSENFTLIENAAANDNRLVLVKLEINTSGNDTLSIWADPSTLNPLGSPTVIIDNQDVFSELGPFTQSKFESPAQSGPAFFDEIRLATTFEDATGIFPPTATPGDYNGDTVVDAADYTVWRDNLGQSAAVLGAARNPAVTDPNVVQADYDFWKASFPNAAVGGIGTAVPEPASLAGLALTVIAGIACRRFAA